MNRALLYLVVMQKKNAIFAFFRSLREPRRFFGTMIWVGFLVFFLVSNPSAYTSAMDRSAARDALPALFSILLLTSSINGLLHRGIAFQPADIDFLFPGPFERRELVMYRLANLYPFALISSLIFVLMLRRTVVDGRIAYVGLVLFSIILIHLQTMLGLAATWIEGRFFKKIRFALRGAGLVLAIALGFAFVGSATGNSQISSYIRDAFSKGAPRIAFYPAAKLAEAIVAPSFIAALPSLLVLVSFAAITLLVVLSMQVNFIEASILTSQQGSLLRARMWRGFVGGDPSVEKAKSAKMPSLALFRGSGAIVWKNLVTASRSMRFIVYAVLAIGIYTAIIIARNRAPQFSHGGPFGPGAGSEDSILTDVLMLGALWPLFIQQYIAFDFRRDFDSLAELKQLPSRPFFIALAEVAVPWLLAISFQALGLAGVAFFEKLTIPTIALATMIYPPVTLTMITITNWGFLMFPSRQAAASRGRAGGSNLSLVAIFNMFISLLALTPAMLVGAFMIRLDYGAMRSVACASAAQFLVAFVLVFLLGRTFARFDVTREMP